MSAVNEPSLARRELGRRLRKLRRDAGMTQEHAADIAELSTGHLRRIESGGVPVRHGNVLALARAYSAANDVTDALVTLAKSTHGKGLWADGSVVPEWFGLYLGLERSARQLETWSPEVISGPFQTEEYARSVLSEDSGADAATIDRRVQLRIERQNALIEQTQVTALIGAGALAISVDSPDVMRRQVDHLRAIAERPNVHIGVVPWHSWPRFLQGPFNILSFDDPDDPDVVYVELLTGGLYLEKAAELGTYRQAYARLFERAVPVKEYNP